MSSTPRNYRKERREAKRPQNQQQQHQGYTGTNPMDQPNWQMQTHAFERGVRGQRRINNNNNNGNNHSRSSSLGEYIPPHLRDTGLPQYTPPPQQQPRPRSEYVPPHLRPRSEYIPPHLRPRSPYVPPHLRSPKKHTSTPLPREKYVPQPIPYSSEYIKKLRMLAQPAAVLKERGFVMGQLTEQEVERKKRCSGCGKMMPKPRKPRRGREEGGRVKLGEGNGEGEEEEVEWDAVEKKEEEKEVLRCRFHSGIWDSSRRIWRCCLIPIHSAPPCAGNPHHIPLEYPQNHLESLWTYHSTPTPLPPRGIHIRPAVSLDCEMGVNIHGDSELIRLSLIDYFTSETLIDSLVLPDVEMLHYNTRYSGVTARDMALATQKGDVICGRDKAREEVWRFVGGGTVVVGHSVNNDLNCLRWVHGWVVDTYLWEVLRWEKEREEERRKKAEEEEGRFEGGVYIGGESSINPSTPVDGKEGTNGTENGKEKRHVRGLKDLTMLKLGRVIQEGKMGHDSVEDAVAARDLAHWIVETHGDELDEDEAERLAAW